MKYLVDNWKQAPKWASMWATLLLGAWLSVPDEQKTALLEAFGIAPAWVTRALLVSIVVGRLWKQKNK